MEVGDANEEDDEMDRHLSSGLASRRGCFALEVARGMPPSKEECLGDCVASLAGNCSDCLVGDESKLSFELDAQSSISLLCRLAAEGGKPFEKRKKRLFPASFDFANRGSGPSKESSGRVLVFTSSGPSWSKSPCVQSLSRLVSFVLLSPPLLTRALLESIRAGHSCDDAMQLLLLNKCESSTLIVRERRCSAGE